MKRMKFLARSIRGGGGAAAFVLRFAVWGVATSGRKQKWCISYPPLPTMNFSDLDFEKEVLESGVTGVVDLKYTTFARSTGRQQGSGAKPAGKSEPRMCAGDGRRRTPSAIPTRRGAAAVRRSPRLVPSSLAVAPSGTELAALGMGSLRGMRADAGRRYHAGDHFVRPTRGRA